jgi:hypothetical protein
MPNPKRPRDPNQRAKLIIDIALGESDEPKAPPAKVADHIWTLKEIAELLD